jgi:histidyl-tRNA synthetase
MRIQRCKGSRDLLPEEMSRFRHIERTFRDCCLGWGYQEVKTPTLEYLHLFTAAGTLTPGMLGKVYSFLDWDGWSGQRVVLRPDGTIPVARLYIDNIAKQGVAKLCYVTNIFRFEETGKESRESWQGGAELIGVSSPLADVELMTLALDVLQKMGIEDVELRLSHAGLIKDLLQNIGLNPKEQAKVFDQILDGDEEALAKIESAKPDLGRMMISLLDMKGKSAGYLSNLKSTLNHSLPELEAHVDNFAGIVELLEATEHNYQIDLTSGRGFEYYTGVIFQLFVGEEKIGGGGRYDALVPLLGGGDIPASGFALYLDHLMQLVAPVTTAKLEERKILVRAEPEVIGQGFAVASLLREAGYVVRTQLADREQATSRWVLEVRGKAPSFVLSDQTKREDVALPTVEEVLAALGGGNADQGSVT